MKKRKLNNYKYYKKKKIDFGPIINRRYGILIVSIIVLMAILIGNLYYVQIVKHEYYTELLATLTRNVVEGDTAPRGRIYDRNGKLLADNVPVKTISYKKITGTTTKEEIVLAYRMAQIIEVDFTDLKDSALRNFWVINHASESRAKITEEEWKQLKERKITNSDIDYMKTVRVTLEELAEYNDLDKEAAHIYYLMTNGYSFSEKNIKSGNVTDEEYAIVAENLSELKGFNTKLNWERYYPYGTYFRSILGTVSSSDSGVPAELKEAYLSMGYQLTDRVGTSYIEYQYESVLRGTKTKYTINSKGEYEILEEGKRGNDIVLTIDIDLQIAVEKAINEELLYTKKNDKYTKHLDRAFVVIQNPNTGEILAMAGKQIVSEKGKYKIYDFTPGVINSAVTPGSSVKAASHMVGYVTGGLQIGEVRNDACIKVAATPPKCSYTIVGNLDDLQALKYSSNTYQFQTAIKVGGATYKYDQPLKINPKAFDTYRSVFAEFGLGVKTGIDLPNETDGYKGNSTVSGLLLDFAIGQYDNYTPIQLSQYIGTVATDGNRMKPYLLKSVYEPTKDKLTSLVYQTTPVILNKVNADPKYMDRIKEGLQIVFAPGGTGSGFINAKYKPAGKTGTSQSFVDTNKDGVIDTETLSTVLVSYAPYNNPTVTFTVVTPNVGTGNISYNQMSKINKRLSQKISKKYFEIYK
jgi:Cell division protein FtsI/penicillin-binding protein 2